MAIPSASHPTDSVPTPATPPASGTSLLANSPAHPFFKPEPVIPEELRGEAIHVTALVRFHIAADGSATAEMITPTPILRLNRETLAAARKWKFFPALKEGKPASYDLDQIFRFDID